jgi:hypothetical protein
VTSLSDLSLFFRELRPVDAAKRLEDGPSQDLLVGMLPPKAEVVSSNLAGARHVFKELACRINR